MLTFVRQSTLDSSSPFCLSFATPHPLIDIDFPSAIRVLTACYQPESLVNLWEKNSYDLDLSVLDYFLIGLAYNRASQQKQTVNMWKEIALPANVPLHLRHEAKARNDWERLRGLVDIAMLLVPEQGSIENPYSEIRQVANDYIDWGLVQQAILLQDLIALHAPSNTLSYWYAVSEAAYLRRDIVQAKKSLAEAKSQWPHDYTLYVREARWLAAENQWEDALKASLAWVDVFPNDPLAVQQVAEVYYRMGRGREAQYWFQKVLQFDLVNDASIFDHAQRRLGNIAYQNSDYEAAVIHFEQIQLLNPNLLQERSDAFWAAGRQDEAIMLMERAVLESRESGVCPAIWYQRLGIWHQERAQSSLAQAAFTNAFQCDPNNSELQTLLEQFND